MSKNKKKILFLITKARLGGAQRYVFDLATNLLGQYDVVVALGGEGTLAEMLKDMGIRVISIPGLQRDISFAKEIVAFRAISHILRTERPDILHVNSSKAGGIGALVGRMHRVPRIIFTAHAWAFNEDRSFIGKCLVGFLHFLTIMLAHKTIAVSEGLKREMHWPLTQKRIVVIHPGRNGGALLDKVTAREALTERVPALKTHTHDTWIGTIAELHPIKRLNVAIDSIAEVIRTHPAVRYVIVGDGELKESLMAQIQKCGLTEHVYLAGTIPDAAQILRAFDVFVLPSRSESFGYVLLEAGHAQLPVVATNVGGIPDIITHEKTGTLIEPDDRKALAEALNRYLENTELRNAHSTALQTQVAHFSVARMTTETVALYEAT